MSRFLAIGGAHMDRRGTIRGGTHMHASNPGAWTLQPGGGAFNAARDLARLGHAVRLISPRGGDEDGALVSRAAAEAGVTDTPITFLDRRTPSYTAILGEDGELVIALAEMDLYDRFSPRQFDRRMMREAIAAADWVLTDANLPAPTLLKLAERCAEAGKPLAAIAISPAKVERLRPILDRLAILFMNEREAVALTGRQQPAAEQISALGAAGLRSGVISAGERPAVAFDAESAWCCEAAPVTDIIDVTGAGDALAAATLAALTRGLALPAALRHGMAAAAIVVASPEASPASLDGAALERSLSGVPAVEPLAKPAAAQRPDRARPPR